MFKRLYSALYDGGCYPFEALLSKDGDVAVAVEPYDLKEQNSALVVWGGSDIDPGLYGHKASKRTYAGAKRRDIFEWGLMAAAIEKKIPIIGVCRGAQMACAKAGGFLIQDVREHGWEHYVTTADDRKFVVNSMHHQMMCPIGTNHELVAWCAPIGQPYIYKEDMFFVPPMNWVEPEFLFFPDIRAYAIQWHPEMMDKRTEATQYVLDYIRKKETENVQRG